jgi:hypothetical protein
MPDNDNVLPFPTPEARRDVQRLLETYEQLSPHAQFAIAEAVEIARLFELLPTEHRQTAAGIVETFARVPEELRAMVLGTVRDLARLGVTAESDSGGAEDPPRGDASIPVEEG